MGRSMCLNSCKCKLRNICLRATRKPQQYQSYSYFYNEGETCDFFINNRGYRNLITNEEYRNILIRLRCD